MRRASSPRRDNRETQKYFNQKESRAIQKKKRKKTIKGKEEIGPHREEVKVRATKKEKDVEWKLKARWEKGTFGKRKSQRKKRLYVRGEWGREPKQPGGNPSKKKSQPQTIAENADVANVVGNSPAEKERSSQTGKIDLKEEKLQGFQTQGR